jgi:hypothetical protein
VEPARGGAMKDENNSIIEAIRESFDDFLSSEHLEFHNLLSELKNRHKSITTMSELKASIGFTGLYSSGNFFADDKQVLVSKDELCKLIVSEFFWKEKSLGLCKDVKYWQESLSQSMDEMESQSVSIKELEAKLESKSKRANGEEVVYLIQNTRDTLK